MITYTNIQRHDNIPFADYLKIGGYSHSFLKYEQNGEKAEIEVTKQMRLGSMVDAILTDPENVDMSDEMYIPGRDISRKIKAQFGQMFQHFEKQVSYTGTVEYKGFKMRTTGRLDFLLPKLAVVDLKVTKMKDVHALIEFMGYKNQLWHYCRYAGVEKGYIMIYSMPLKQTFIVSIDCSDKMNEFWAGKILKLGEQ